MSIKKILSIIVISVAVIIVILVGLLIRSCQLHTDSLYGIKVTDGGNGGAIAVYEEKLGGNIYAQKISPEGKTQWGEKGILLGSSHSESYSFSSFNLVSDGAGGAIVAWPDSSKNQFRPTSHLARIDAEGKILWQRDFIYFKHMISDGAGGAIIAFDYYVGLEEKDLTIVKIDSQGNYSWGLQGITIPRQRYQDNTLQITPDSSGGAIVSWKEPESPPGSMPGIIFAQRVDSSGKPLWGNGVSLYATPEGTWVESPQLTSDGMGGVVVCWFQMTQLLPDSSGQRSQTWDIVVQKIDANGKVLWQPEGVPLEITKTTYNAAPSNPALVSDDSGGAIIIWRDSRSDAQGQASVYAQKVDAGGNLKWQTGGVKVSSASLNPRSLIIDDGSGDAIISYSFQKDGQMLHVQKLDGNGRTVWPGNGISVTEGGFTSQFIASDGQGGVIVAWGIGKGMFNSEKAYVQRVSAEGKLLWGEDGIRLNK